MKKHEVKLGGEYIAKVSGRLAHVRIDRENPHGGWEATNLATKKSVRIKSAQRLRAEAGVSKAEVKAAKTAVAAQVGAGAKPAAESPKDAKAAPTAARGEAKAALGRVAKDVSKVLGVPVAVAPDAKAEKVAKAAKPKGERKPGILTLAADVLRDAKAPMDCKAIVEKVIAKGLWQTKGKTPHSTLYAAIIREIAAKGKEARFHKTDRGMFELSAAARK